VKLNFHTGIYCLHKWLLFCALLCVPASGKAWGFYAHKLINYYATFLLPPEMMAFYKPNVNFIKEHAVDPDKRRYALKGEAARHYMDLDRYGVFPFSDLPRSWPEAVAKYTEDSLQAHGIVPWWIPTMKYRLTEAFKNNNAAQILKYSAEIGHYIADAHVPLHSTSNYNGQLSNQHGIHAFWESRVPELLAEQEWDFYIGNASYIENVSAYAWQVLLGSHAAVDSVLGFEKKLDSLTAGNEKYAFEDRNGMVIKQFSTPYSIAYNKMLNGMIERRMRQSIMAVASFWFTAWVDAGQPALGGISDVIFSKADAEEFENLNAAWRIGKGNERAHE